MDFGYVTLEPVAWIRTALRLVHFAGIILGIGAATLLDLIVFRFVLSRRIEDNSIRIIIFSSYVIMTGLALLWVSGLGFFVYYYFFDPTKIANPKLVAKIVIVGVLTLNAILVHSVCLPEIKRQTGLYLLEGLTRLQSILLVAVGTISAISWYVPLLLGIVPQFNNTIPSEVILAVYAILIVSVNIMVQIMLVIIQLHGRK
jgi:hypothetical protein